MLASHFELATDSKVVAALLTNDTSSSRRQNFLLRMAAYDFTAVHRKGELNRNSDFFSRWARYEECEDQRRAIPPVINAIIFDEAHWWRATRRCHRPMADFEARCAAGEEPKMSTTAAATSAISM